MRLRCYLSPEPLLQSPEYVKDEAQAGYATPTYAYARNNPIRYTNPTGLYSYRVECPDIGPNSRGMVFSYIDVFHAPPVRLPGTGASGIDTASGNACDDLDLAIELERQNANDPTFQIQRDCWKALKREIKKNCRGIQKPPERPRPPAGYCAK